MTNAETRILVVDDLATMRKVLGISLEQMGCRQVTFGDSGIDALRIVEHRTFDLIISDYDMPDIDGLDVLRAIRLQPKHRNVPFLMLSQAINSDKALDAIAAGANDVLIKPFKSEVFKEKVSGLLDLNRAFQRPAEPIEREAPERNGSSARKVIAVIDDTRHNNDLIADFLEPEFCVVTGTSGLEALAIAESRPAPDLILLDILMPEMDGLEVCRRLKANPLTEAIPVIFLSALGQAEYVVNGLRFGAVDYVTKPLNLDVLRARIDTHIQLKQAHDKLQQQIDLEIKNTRLREDVERITRHDLKNPLSAILNVANVLASVTDLDASIREGLVHIEESAYEMLGMINRSLDLYKMETGTYRFSPQPVDLVSVLEKVRRDALAVAKTKRVSVVADLPSGGIIVAGEELLCYSLFGNLVRNAVEASPRGGVVHLESDSETPHIIRIKNAGAIPKEIRDRFFDKYATHGKQSGTGLGTYSAKLITEVQGGAISFKTSEKDGTLIQVALKAYLPPPSAAVENASGL